MPHPFREIPRLVCSLEMTTHHERPVLIGLFHPTDRLIRHDIRGETSYPLPEITLTRPRVRTVYESRVPVLALVMKHGIEVETLRLRFQMPFTDQSGLIASRPHLLGDIILLRIKRIT